MFRTKLFWFFWIPLLVAILAACVDRGLLEPLFGSHNVAPRDMDPGLRTPSSPTVGGAQKETKEKVTALLGKERLSKRVQAFLKSFSKGEEHRVEEGLRYTVEEEGFEALFNANDRLEKLVFHSDQSLGFQSFSEDRLPDSDRISFSDTQLLVRARLGEPKYGDEGWDIYERPQYLLYVEYGENGCVLRISFVHPDAILPHPYNSAG